MDRDRETLGEWRSTNYPCGKEKADDETGQKVLVGGGSRTDKRSECGDVRGMMSLSWPSPLLGCLGRCETSGSSVTSSMFLRELAVTKPQQRPQGHSCRSTWQGKCPCRTVPPLCLLWRWQGKRDQPGKKQSAGGSQHGWGWAAVFCLTGVTAWEQRQREKCCSDNSIDTPREKSEQKPAIEVAGKAEEEIVQVKKQERGSDTGMHLEMPLGTELEQGLQNFPRIPWKRMFLSSPLSHFELVRGTWGL